jgi:hypothetical protein
MLLLFLPPTPQRINLWQGAGFSSPWNNIAVARRRLLENSLRGHLLENSLRGHLLENSLRGHLLEFRWFSVTRRRLLENSLRGHLLEKNLRGHRFLPCLFFLLSGCSSLQPGIPLPCLVMSQHPSMPLFPKCSS